MNLKVNAITNRPSLKLPKRYSLKTYKCLRLSRQKNVRISEHRLEKVITSGYNFIGVTKKSKLELTWIGKENRPRLEPRILLEDPAKSYHAKQRVTDIDLFDNVLISNNDPMIGEIKLF